MSNRLRATCASLAALLTAAIGGLDSGEPVAGATRPEPTADPSAELRYGSLFGHNTFDPHRVVGSGDVLFLRPVYDRLITIVPDVEEPQLGPELATSWEFAPDGLSLELELRDDVTFQDGTPFDASAVHANLERAMGPDSTVSSDLDKVESVEVVDATHVVLHLTTPDPSIPWSFAIGSSGMMVSPDAFDTDLAATPVGSGPFRLVSAQKDAEVTYERWDGHWDPDAALVERLTISTIADNNARYSSIRSGETDVAYLSSPQDAESESLVDDGFQRQVALTPVLYGMMLNSSMAPFDDVRVRRAVYLAVNRAEISASITNGMNPPASQPFAPGVPGYDPDIDDSSQYEPDAARALVEEAGVAGASIRILHSQNFPNGPLAQVLQQALGDIGLEVELVPLSSTEARTAWREGGDHAFVGPIVGRQEPSVTLNLSYLGGDNPADPPPEFGRPGRRSARHATRKRRADGRL